MNYIYVDFNGGSPAYAVTTTYTDINLMINYIGRVYRNVHYFIYQCWTDIQDAIFVIFKTSDITRMEWHLVQLFHLQQQHYSQL